MSLIFPVFRRSVLTRALWALCLTLLLAGCGGGGASGGNISAIELPSDSTLLSPGDDNESAAPPQNKRNDKTAPVSGNATTTVTVTTTLTKELKTVLTITNTVTKRVATTISSTATLTKKVRTTAHITSKFTTTVKNVQTLTKKVTKEVTTTLVNDLTSTVTNTLTLTKKVTKDVTTTATLTNDITSTVTNTLTLTKKVTKEVETTVTLTKDVTKEVTTTTTLTEQVTTTITKVRKITEEVIKEVTTTATLTNHVTTRITNKFTSTVTSTSTLTKQVTKEVTTTMTNTLTNDITTTMTSTQTITEQITTTIKTTSTLTERITATATATITLGNGLPLEMQPVHYADGRMSLKNLPATDAAFGFEGDWAYHYGRPTRPDVVRAITKMMTYGFSGRWRLHNGASGDYSEGGGISGRLDARYDLDYAQLKFAPLRSADAARLINPSGLFSLQPYVLTGSASPGGYFLQSHDHGASLNVGVYGNGASRVAGAFRRLLTNVQFAKGGSSASFATAILNIAFTSRISGDAGGGEPTTLARMLWQEAYYADGSSEMRPLFPASIAFGFEERRAFHYGAPARPASVAAIATSAMMMAYRFSGQWRLNSAGGLGAHAGGGVSGRLDARYDQDYAELRFAPIRSAGGSATVLGSMLSLTSVYTLSGTPLNPKGYFLQGGKDGDAIHVGVYGSSAASIAGAFRRTQDSAKVAARGRTVEISDPILNIAFTSGITADNPIGAVWRKVFYLGDDGSARSLTTYQFPDMRQLLHHAPSLTAGFEQGRAYFYGTHLNRHYYIHSTSDAFAYQFSGRWRLTDSANRSVYYGGSGISGGLTIARRAVGEWATGTASFAPFQNSDANSVTVLAPESVFSIIPHTLRAGESGAVSFIPDNSGKHPFVAAALAFYGNNAARLAGALNMTVSGVTILVGSRTVIMSNAILNFAFTSAAAADSGARPTTTFGVPGWYKRIYPNGDSKMKVLEGATAAFRFESDWAYHYGLRTSPDAVRAIAQTARMSYRFSGEWQIIPSGRIIRPTGGSITGSINARYDQDYAVLGFAPFPDIDGHSIVVLDKPLYSFASAYTLTRDYRDQTGYYLHRTDSTSTVHVGVYGSDASRIAGTFLGKITGDRRISINYQTVTLSSALLVIAFTSGVASTTAFTPDSAAPAPFSWHDVHYADGRSSLRQFLPLADVTFGFENGQAYHYGRETSQHYIRSQNTGMEYHFSGQWMLSDPTDSSSHYIGSGITGQLSVDYAAPGYIGGVSTSMTFQPFQNSNANSISVVNHSEVFKFSEQYYLGRVGGSDYLAAALTTGISINVRFYGHNASRIGGVFQRAHTGDANILAGGSIVTIANPVINIAFASGATPPRPVSSTSRLGDYAWHRLSEADGSAAIRLARAAEAAFGFNDRHAAYHYGAQPTKPSVLNTLAAANYAFTGNWRIATPGASYAGHSRSIRGTLEADFAGNSAVMNLDLRGINDDPYMDLEVLSGSGNFSLTTLNYTLDGALSGSSGYQFENSSAGGGSADINIGIYGKEASHMAGAYRQGGVNIRVNSGGGNSADYNNADFHIGIVGEKE